MEAQYIYRRAYILVHIERSKQGVHAKNRPIGFLLTFNYSINTLHTLLR